MSPRRAISGLIVLALLVGAWVLWRSQRAPQAADPAPSSAAAGARGSAPTSVGIPPATTPQGTAGDRTATATPQPARSRLPRATWEALAKDYPIAAKLTAPDSTMERDLFAVDALMDAWRTNFPRQGNPVGDNAQITAALTGDNPLKLALLPADHPAINEHGELCDRYGTPFRLHQLSGEHMEVRSAGADRKFGTADDAFWSPPGAPVTIR